MTRLYVEGVGLRAPGLEGWTESLPLLRGERAYEAAPLNLPPSTLLPANERRRMVTTVKLALLVGAEAFAQARRDPAETATVFTSSGGDGETIDAILETLTSATLEVSPTRFHNSVHNAPSGYWSIATKSRAPTTSLCGHDWSFAAGLLDAAAQAAVEEQAVGLIAYDLPYPEPLDSKRPIGSTFGVALVLAPQPSATCRASLAIALDRKRVQPTPMDDPRLEALRAGNPAARSLPLLAAIARGSTTEVALDDFGGNTVTVAIAPCDR